MAVSIAPAAAPKPAPEPTFTKVSAEPKKRLILSVEALQKRGKTNFALTAPGPICVHNFDSGLEGVAHKFADKDLFSCEYRLPLSNRLPGSPTTPLVDAAIKVWEEFVSNYRASLKRFKSVVIDTESESWELARLARLGKLASVLPHQYTTVNSEYRELLRLALDSDANLILLRKMKKEYINDKPTGGYIGSGFGDTGFIVQCTLHGYREDGAEGLDKFKMRVVDCRQNPLLGGTIITGTDINFPKLATMILPGTTEDDWK